MVKVKICGITNLDDALAAVEYGADALGFVFYDKSPRRISADKALEIILKLPPVVTTVGVFVDEKPEEVERTMRHAGLDVAQFHGHEPPEACLVARRAIKAIRVKELSDLEPLGRYSVSAYLLDAYTPDKLGGTGEIFNWDIALEAKRFGRVILAGGLRPDNVARAVHWVHPYAVDVSSGVEEEKGKKDMAKLRQFIRNAKEALP
ncbi:MAG: phosphoribosylanthranilate isomerase [Thermodesulfovibrionales bacterium]